MTNAKNIYKSMTDEELRNVINTTENDHLANALHDLLDARIARRTRAALKEHAAENAARLLARMTR